MTLLIPRMIWVALLILTIAIGVNIFLIGHDADKFARRQEWTVENRVRSTLIRNFAAIRGITLPWAVVNLICFFFHVFWGQLHLGSGSVISLFYKTKEKPSRDIADW